MVGFFIFILTVVLGALGLIAGLRLLGLVQSDVPAARGEVTREHLEQLQDALLAVERRLDELRDQQLFLERLLTGREARASLPKGPRAPSGEREAEESGVDSILFDQREGER
jgi:hypothetical protein